ncbi:MAG TPA: PAS domain S-box protein [Verrucomicrobiae bacterium]|nr:PAS domain S-box protein [Verrucomicrobiae bacterium]
MTGKTKIDRAGLALGVGVWLVVLAGVGVALRQIQANRAELEHQAEQELESVAALKAQQLAGWRAERLADASFFSNAEFVRRDVSAFLRDRGSSVGREEMIRWMNLLKGGERYERVWLFNAQGNRQLSVPPDTNPPCACLQALLPAGLHADQVSLSDIERDPADGHLCLQALLPVRGGNQTEAPGAAHPLIVVTINPRSVLFPMIQTWPVANATAEVLLLRLAGDEAVVLNELRHRTNTALQMKLPLDASQALTLQALRAGKGVWWGKDYRGVPVVAAVRPVPGTPWVLVAKMDEAEFSAPLRGYLWSTVLLLVVLALSGLLVGSVLLRRQRTRHLREELTLERAGRALAERFAILMENAGDIILLMDSELRVVEANRQAVEVFGFSLAELREKRLPELLAPGAAAELPRRLEQVQGHDSLVEVAEGRHRDGHSFHVEINGRRVMIDGVDRLLLVGRDISARLQQEQALREAQRELQAIVDQAGSLIGVKALDGRYRLVNQALAGRLGRPAEALLGCTDDELLPREAAERARGQHQEVVRRRKPLICEETFTEADGAHTYLSLKFPLTDEQGELYGVGSIATDITGRKETEEKLRAQADELRANYDALARFNRVVVGRELRMIELKREINELCRQLGRPAPYVSDLTAVGLAPEDVAKPAAQP